MGLSSKVGISVFLDTSIYERGNFMHGNEIKQILSLAEFGHVEILMPYITYREIISRAEKNIRESTSKVSGLQKAARIFRNFNQLSNLFELINEDQLIIDFKMLFDDLVKKSKIVILEYPTINIGSVFDKYFEKQFPFSETKKSEFTDAFTLQTLELWCLKNKKQCYIFSDDKDILNYKQTWFIISNDLKGFTNDILTEIELKNYENNRLERIQELFNDKNDYLKDEIAAVVQEEIENDPDQFVDSYYTLANIEVTEISVWLGAYQLVSITSGDIIIESMAEASYCVSATIDEENTPYYDNFEDDWNYDSEENITIRDSKKMSVQFILYIPASGDLKYMDIILHEVKFSNH